MISSIIEGLRRAGLVVLLGAVAGLAVYLMSEGSLPPEAWSPVVIGNCILVGILYVAVLDGTVRVLRLVMDAFVPLTSMRAVAYHSLLPAAGALMGYVGVTAILKALVGDTFTTSWILLLEVGVGMALLVAGGISVLALRNYYRRERQEQAQGWETRMRRVRTQAVPPILFDTLEHIESHLDEQPDDAATLIDRLQSFLQYRIHAASDEPVLLADELQAALWYVELVQVQYGDDLDVGFDIPDPLLSVPIPRLSLLPLFENAVEHGVAAADESCTITVTGRHDDAQLCLAVLDTGPGFDTTDPSTILRRGSGLSDLYGRLRDHFGSAAELSLLPQGVLWCAPLPASQQSEDSVESGPSVSAPPPE